MIFADDIRKAILKLANQRGPGELFYPAEVARIMDPENWAKQVEQVTLVAESLIQEGQIVSTDNGKSFETSYSKATLLKATS